CGSCPRRSTDRQTATATRLCGCCACTATSVDRCDAGHLSREVAMTDTTHDTAPAGEPQATDTPPAQPETAQDDQPLGEAGLKALQKEREARKALERRLAALAPLERLAAALAADQGADDGKTDVQRLAERLDAYERQLAEERMARWRV